MKKVITLALLVFLWSCVNAQANKDRLHAMLVLDIVRNSEFPLTNNEYVIAVLGVSPVHDELKVYTQNVKVYGHPVRVIQLATVDEVDAPQIIFISEKMSPSFADLLAKTKSRPMIVISEDEKLYTKGAEFSVVRKDTTGFHVNVNYKALRERQIKISRALDPIIKNRI